MFNETLRVHLIDTPGFDDTIRTDRDVLEQVASWLSATYDINVRMSGIVYLHRISDTRIQGSARRNLIMFRKLCGPGCLPNIILATTFWDITNPGVGAERERELIQVENFWGFMHSRGSAVLRHSGSRESAMAILEWALRNRRRLTLQIQREINIEGLYLDETEAGRELIGDILRERQQLERELRQLKESYKEAVEMGDQDFAQALDDEGRHLQQKLEQSSLNDRRLDLASLRQLFTRTIEAEDGVEQNSHAP